MSPEDPVKVALIGEAQRVRDVSDALVCAQHVSRPQDPRVLPPCHW